jgi:hypothetical protein
MKASSLDPQLRRDLKRWHDIADRDVDAVTKGPHQLNQPPRRWRLVVIDERD